MLHSQKEVLPVQRVAPVVGSLAWLSGVWWLTCSLGHVPGMAAGLIISRGDSSSLGGPWRGGGGKGSHGCSVGSESLLVHSVVVVIVVVVLECLGTSVAIKGKVCPLFLFDCILVS